MSYNEAPSYLPLSGGTLTGDLILSTSTPPTDLSSASKGYVDSVATGLNIQTPCYAATTANLAGYTYANGSSGIGATLTAGSTGVFSVDGINPPVNSRILVKNQSTTFQNGIYNLTTSSGGTNAVLTRSTDFDTPAEIQPGDFVIIENGNQATLGFLQTATVTAVGTDPILFSQFGQTITSITKYIVGATQSNYLTITSAIAAAVANGASSSSPVLIYVQPGTYNENITLEDGIVICGLDATGGYGVAFQPSPDSKQTVKLTGSVTFNTTSLTTVGAYASIQNLWISPATGNAISFLGANNVTGNHCLYFKNCRVDNNADNTYALSADNCNVLFDSSCVFDMSPTSLAHFYTLSGTNPTFITAFNCSIYTGYGAASTLAASTQPSLRVVNSVYTDSVDATLSAAYNFRMVDSVHQLVGALNVVPWHVTGASTGGRIIYDNCTVTINDPAVAVATIGSATLTIEFNNTNFGNLQVPSSDIVTGGRQIFTNCGIQSTSTFYYNRNDFIKVGYGGASKITSQAGVTTSNATTTTLASVVVNQGESITLQGTISAQKSDSSDACGGNFLITARRATAGDITLVGSPLINVNTTSTATFTVEADVGSESIRIRVTGIAATTYYWVADYSYQKVLTSTA